jgi:hypothetical protein
MSVPIVAGVCANCCCEQTTCSPNDVENVFHLWTTGQGSVSSECWNGTASGQTALMGGFIWTYGDVAESLEQYVDAMDGGLAQGAANSRFKG